MPDRFAVGTRHVMTKGPHRGEVVKVVAARPTDIVYRLPNGRTGARGEKTVLKHRDFMATRSRPL